MPTYTTDQLAANGCTITSTGDGSFNLVSPSAGVNSSAIVYF
jgi:hypothetical protein